MYDQCTADLCSQRDEGDVDRTRKSLFHTVEEHWGKSEAPTWFIILHINYTKTQTCSNLYLNFSVPPPLVLMRNQPSELLLSLS